MARWDDLRRAILAKDQDGTERIWIELTESGPGDVPRFLEASTLLERQPGGRRQAGVLLYILVEALKGAGKQNLLLPVYARLGSVGPDDGSVRQAALDMVRENYSGRGDLDMLLEKSRLVGGSDEKLAEQIENLERYLKIEKDAYVYHRSGWGVGKVVDYSPERGRCVIDFQDREGHEMEVEAAANLLERLEEDDIRVRAVTDQRALRAYAKEEPLVVLEQVLGWYNNSVNLRNIKGALVPDAVAPSTWSTWWKKARKLALLDPRFDVGPGRDPKVELHEVAGSDFRSQVEMVLKRSATVIAKQKQLRELRSTVGTDEEAVGILAEIAERELERSSLGGTARLGWEIVLAELRGEAPAERLAGLLAAEDDPLGLVCEVNDDKVREVGLEAFLKAKGEDGIEDLLTAAIEQDDAVAAAVGQTWLKKNKADERIVSFLDQADDKPALHPAVYAWYLKALVRGKWEGREYEALTLSKRVLKVIDAVEYRTRRGGGTARDKKAITQLGDVLADKKGVLVKEAAEACDEASARHLAQLISTNRGLRAVVQGRLQDVVTGVWPTALKSPVVAEVDDADAAETANQIYMTAEGLEKLKEEARRIEQDDMPQTRAEIARAREFGDLKENAEYHAAREKQGLLQAQLDKTKGEITRAEIITPAIIGDKNVTVGCRVRVRDTDGSEASYTLFGPPDVDVENGVINYMTPLGRALMSKSVGDTARLEVDGAVREVEVLSIESGL